MKWVSLLALTLQTSGQAILIKWSKANSSEEEDKYLSSTAVFFTEVLKTLVSLGLVVLESGGVPAARASIVAHFSQSPSELLKAAVPSLIYTIQNNLMFYSFEKLSAPVQQVLYQMKIISTAGLGVLMLGKSLTEIQWVSCFLLACGVAMVQLPQGGLDPTQVGGDWLSSDHVKGFIAVFCACLTSGFAGVWIQKMLQQTTASIWMRNVQLGSFGLTMGLLVTFVQDGDKIMEKGFLQGYNHRVLAVICMTAFGGLLCAVMLKYAGATHGCFSTAISIVLTNFLSKVILSEFAADPFFLVGTAMTISASLLFALGLPEWIHNTLGICFNILFQPTGVVSATRASTV